MAVKLGTSSVTLKLGTQSVTGYLGSAIVTATVPGAPTITSATQEGIIAVVVFSAPESDGGSAITEYRVYVDGILSAPDSTPNEFTAEFDAELAGAEIEVSAVNAVGEGPKSAPVTVT